jgi:hypothetical protein
VELYLHSPHGQFYVYPLLLKRCCVSCREPKHGLIECWRESYLNDHSRTRYEKLLKLQAHLSYAFPGFDTGGVQLRNAESTRVTSLLLLQCCILVLKTSTRGSHTPSCYLKCEYTLFGTWPLFPHRVYRKTSVSSARLLSLFKPQLSGNNAVMWKR